MTFLISLLIFTACVWILLVRSKMRGDTLDQEQSHRNGSSAIHANTSEAGHSHTYYVTKDQDAYAKIFIPRGK